LLIEELLALSSTEMLALPKNDGFKIVPMPKQLPDPSSVSKSDVAPEIKAPPWPVIK
jgi:hypothetical protein